MDVAPWWIGWMELGLDDRLEVLYGVVRFPD